MNLSDAEKQKEQVWSQPLQVPSRSANDAEDSVLLSSIQQQQQQQQQRQQSVLDHASSPQRIKRSGGYAVKRKRANDALAKASKSLGEDNTSRLLLSPGEPRMLPEFRLRPLSLDRGALAPALARPTAPFVRPQKKKAFVSAIYYSECFLRNIRPIDADSAAFDAQNQYTKWWVQSKKSPSSPLRCTNIDEETHSNFDKRRRLDQADISEDCEETNSLHIPRSQSPIMTQEHITLLKEHLIDHLQKTGGDTTAAAFRNCLQQLKSAYVHRKAANASTKASTTVNQSPATLCIDGTWLTLSKPTFSECQGRNQHGEYMYTLGRMTFDMFRPNKLRCSIRAVMNNIRVMDSKHKPKSFPLRLGQELERHNKATALTPADNPIHHYDIVVAFTIEANQTRYGNNPESSSQDEFVVPRPIRGLMTNHGYMVSDPRDSNRSSIWFSGGSIEVQDEVADGELWKQIFDESMAPRRDMRAMANVLAAKLLLGASTATSSNDDGGTGSDDSSGSDRGDHSDGCVPTMSYVFKRPIGGHGEVYCDALYMDESLRIMQGHRGSIFVFTRVPT